MPHSKQETQRQTILHLWNEGICNGHEIHTHTNIPLSTIYDNIKKLKKTGTVEHKGGNGRPKKLLRMLQKHSGSIFEGILHFQPALWQRNCAKRALKCPT